jgi:hypothetical protein
MKLIFSLRNAKRRFLLYLRLFLGMGFIWTFEIIAGLFGDTLPESTWYVKGDTAASFFGE